MTQTSTRAIKRILLLVPPALTHPETRDINPLPPVGLGYLAAVLEGQGFEVSIIDTLVCGWENETALESGLVRVGMAYDDIADLIGKANPDLIGLSCQFSRQHEIYRDILALCKRHAPKAPTVAGGAHVTVCPEEMLSCKDCDAIVLGEAEESFIALIRAMESGVMEDLDGVGWKREGKPHITPKTKWIQDLDSIPSPAYHLMNLQHYFGLPTSHGTRHRHRYMPVITSRGCPSKCVFCSAKRVWGDTFRARSVDSVIQEMRLLQDTHGIEEIMFEDDNLTADPARAATLFQRMIDERFTFIWDTPNGVGAWSLTPKLIDLMKASRCVRINFPIESGSQDVLRNVVRKPLSLNKASRLMHHCRKIGMEYGMFLVIGMPGETLADIWKSFRYAAENKVFDPFISIATPYPGTELFDICTSRNLFRKKYEYSDLFIRSYLIETPEWTEGDLRDIQAKGRSYLRRKRILSSPGEFFGALGQGVGLIAKGFAHPIRAFRYIFSERA